MKLQRFALIALLMVAGTAGARDEGKQPGTAVLSAAQAELSRSFEHLGKQPVPPYFLSYAITESHSVSVMGSFGTLRQSHEARNRQLDIGLRVGDYTLDNTRKVRGAFPNFMDQYSSVAMPLEDDADDVSADFSREKPETASEAITPIKVDRKLWEEKVRRYTAPFKAYGDIYDANAGLSASRETRWFVSSEGSAIQTSRTYYRLFISASTKADDGMELPRYESFFSFTPEGLPDDAAVLKVVEKMIADLRALKIAPVTDPYTGPAILSGRATGVFFHEVFGHRMEGHRQKNEDEAQTFKKMVGQAVLPDFLSVYFDPTVRKYGGTDLVGSYSFDDEGVRARRVTAVENGILKNFLMSRSPIEGFATSNGHGRAQPGFAPVARQSNLQVVSSKAISREKLKDLLIEQIKKENKPYGLLFDDIQGGFTLTGRTIPNAFNVLPVMVYRIYPDRREELVRGVDLIGTPLTVFSKIVAAADDISIFNGICGAESGGVPVSAGGPAILVSQIEAQKKQKSQERSPILAPPTDDK